jgi:hypothetical protein
LAVVERYPGVVRTLVAHEPPLTELLPDAAEHRAWVEQVERTYRAEGMDAAFAKFLVGAGLDAGGPSVPELPEAVLAEMRANNAYFFEHMPRGTTAYRPDVVALHAAPTRIVVAAVSTNRDQIAHRTARALAEPRGSTPVGFAGDHAGFLGQAAEFAEVLRRELR